MCMKKPTKLRQNAAVDWPSRQQIGELYSVSSRQICLGRWMNLGALWTCCSPWHSAWIAIRPRFRTTTLQTRVPAWRTRTLLRASSRGILGQLAPRMTMAIPQLTGIKNLVPSTIWCSFEHNLVSDIVRGYGCQGTVLKQLQGALTCRCHVRIIAGARIDPGTLPKTQSARYASSLLVAAYCESSTAPSVACCLGA